MPYEFLDLDTYQEPQQEPGIASTLAGGLTKGLTSLALKGADIPVGIANLGVGAVNLAAKALPEKAQRLTPGGKVEFPYLPTPSELVHKHIVEPQAEKLVGKGGLKPAGTKGESFQEFMSDLGTFTDPAKLIKEGKIPFRNSLIKAGLLTGAGNTASWLTQELGYSKETGQAVKMGTMLGATLFGKESINSYVNNAYKSARDVPKGLKVPVIDSAKKLSDIKQSMEDVSFPDKEKVVKFIDTLLGEEAKTSPKPKHVADKTGFIKTTIGKPIKEATKKATGFGKKEIEWDKLIEHKENANEWWPKLGTKAQRYMGKVNKAIKDDINNAYHSVRDAQDRHRVKAAAESLNHADAIFSARAEAGKIGDWLDVAKKASPYLTSIPAYLFGGKWGALASLGIPASKWAYETGKFIAKNEDVQKAYKNIFKAYGMNNKKLAESSLALIDRMAAKELPALMNKQEETGYKFLN